MKRETPVDHGEIICFSIYSGPEADFGNGKSCIWVDVLDGGGRDLLVEFAPFFEDPSIQKVCFYLMVLLIYSAFCLALLAFIQPSVLAIMRIFVSVNLIL